METTEVCIHSTGTMRPSSIQLGLLQLFPNVSRRRLRALKLMNLSSNLKRFISKIHRGVVGQTMGAAVLFVCVSRHTFLLRKLTKKRGNHTDLLQCSGEGNQNRGVHTGVQNRPALKKLKFKKLSRFFRARTPV